MSIPIPLDKSPCAQPRDEDALDPVFLEKLHAVLDLTDANDIHVILDNHGDMVGTAGCGNGVPMWFQQKAAPELIGNLILALVIYKTVPSYFSIVPHNVLNRMVLNKKSGPKKIKYRSVKGNLSTKCPKLA